MTVVSGTGTCVLGGDWKRMNPYGQVPAVYHCEKTPGAVAFVDDQKSVSAHKVKECAYAELWAATGRFVVTFEEVPKIEDPKAPKEPPPSPPSQAVIVPDMGGTATARGLSATTFVVGGAVSPRLR